MRLPSVVKQMGKVTGESRVYIEDYVYTYLNELKKKKNSLPVRVALYGHAFSRENIHYYLIYGASGVVEEMENGRNQEEIGKQFFVGYSLIGYVNIYEKQNLPGTEEGCYIFYESNEAMQNYMLSCFKRKKKLNEEEKDKCQAYGGNKKAGEKFALSFIRELFCKTFLGLTVMLTAVAVVTIDNYGCMYDFTMMAVRVLQAAGQ